MYISDVEIHACILILGHNWYIYKSLGYKRRKTYSAVKIYLFSSSPSQYVHSKEYIYIQALGNKFDVRGDWLFLHTASKKHFQSIWFYIPDLLFHILKNYSQYRSFVILKPISRQISILFSNDPNSCTWMWLCYFNLWKSTDQTLFKVFKFCLRKVIFDLIIGPISSRL